ncbi:MAG: hypothetical protein WBB43_26945 [Limnoraphis sp.]
MTSGSSRFNVYIEPELKTDAEKLAKKQRRSLSALVCVLLEKAVEEAKENGEITDSD